MPLTASGRDSPFFCGSGYAPDAEIPISCNNEPMSASPAASQPANDSPKQRIGRVRSIVILVLAALFFTCLLFLWLTRDAVTSFSFLRPTAGQQSKPGARKTLVDISPWQTAETLAALAVTAEEKQYARDAERLADHDVDQAFAAALRQASLNATHKDLSGKALALSQRVQQLQEMVGQDKMLVQMVTSGKGEPGAAAEKGQFDEDDLAVAKAQMDLDADQLNDAQEDLARATGDNRADIQAELNAHEASMRKYDSEVNGTAEIAIVSTKRYGTLAGRIGAWFRQFSRIDMLQQAQQNTNANITRLTTAHNTLAAAANASQAAISAAHDRANILATMQVERTQRQILSIYNDRIQTETQLAAVYGKWAGQVQLQHRILLHLILQSLSVVILILILTIVGDTMIRRIMRLPSIERRQMHMLRMVLELAVQVIGGLLILLVIFGAPQQTPTILGLVTAGVTIVMQDFILAFFGWFFLMGKNGLRVGDWVEINGVAGEVIEVGIIYTTLLETGKLDDKGHPTGRRIAFINSFAIRGQYFNFTTSGQWMWDELAVAVPATADPRVFLEKVQKTVLEETESDAHVAEQEWKRSLRGDRADHFRTAPVVTLRPVAGGTEILVRYMTRASKRFDVRDHINQRVVDILREPAV